MTQLILEGENDLLTGTNFFDDGFKIAFSVENFHTKEERDDPRYVRWVAYLDEYFDGGR